MKGHGVAAFGCSRPNRSLTEGDDLLVAIARLVTDDGSGSALALKAVAHGDARWFAVGRQRELPAAAGGASNGHGTTSWMARTNCNGPGSKPPITELQKNIR